jgi:hypothetical protein
MKINMKFFTVNTLHLSYKNQQAKLYKEIITVRFEIRKKYRNLICEQKIPFLDVKPGGTYSNH